MFIPYCSFEGDIEVSFTPLNKDNKTVVHIEIPDEVYCFKTADCTIPSYQLSGVVGMTNEELALFVEFCRHNAHIILQAARDGGILDA